MEIICFQTHPILTFSLEKGPLKVWELKAQKLNCVLKFVAADFPMRPVRDDAIIVKASYWAILSLSAADASANQTYTRRLLMSYCHSTVSPGSMRCTQMSSCYCRARLARQRTRLFTITTDRRDLQMRYYEKSPAVRGAEIANLWSNVRGFFNCLFLSKGAAVCVELSICASCLCLSRCLRREIYIAAVVR